ncbi:endonuclease/exonuclease/phosphatase family protein [Chryseobacterium sp. JUb7]|uniref:endonuclease/exonuclease/phosphatase family protein n=1 Tax=Chryseobacterium sp. JUb7 TaxID=2940599 RepID=UPI00216A7A98|nr:endonuclease/exonuclease/phosphatase family protein [Chryseobacterium sp. JUb7]MCS3530292.1 endonuclease/exonuclease/phosphatase (EEP) superfamily protein YafD [Chryseobacterium sp. JUb7]
MKVLRLVFLIFHIGIFLLLLGMLMNAYVPPKIFPWFNLLSLGFPVLVIGYVLLTFFWIFSWKKRAFLFMFLGLIFIGPVKRWVNYSSDKKQSADLKIVSFNIKAGGFGVENIEKYINSLNADVVLLQEYGGDKKYEFTGLKSGQETQLISIYSKYKIIDQKQLIDSNYEYNNAYANQTDIEIKGKIYRFINVYLQPFKFEKSMVKLNGNSDADEEKLKNIVKRLIPTFKMHQEQVEKVRKGIDNSPYPVILVGDFNSVPNSYEYYHLSEGLKDAFVEVGKGSATSFHDYKFPIRIDYVFSSKTIEPISYKVDRSVKLSDHYPVISTFKLNP